MTATLEIQALTQEWLSDADAMPDERREALLDRAREIMQGVVDKHDARLGTEKRVEVLPGVWLNQVFFPADRTLLGYDVAASLDLEIEDADRLCEEAGYP